MLGPVPPCGALHLQPCVFLDCNRMRVPRLDGNPCCGSPDLVWDQEGVLAAGCKVVGCLER